MNVRIPLIIMAQLSAVAILSCDCICLVVPGKGCGIQTGYKLLKAWPDRQQMEAGQETLARMGCSVIVTREIADHYQKLIKGMKFI